MAWESIIQSSKSVEKEVTTLYLRRKDPIRDSSPALLSLFVTIFNSVIDGSPHLTTAPPTSQTQHLNQRSYHRSRGYIKDTTDCVLLQSNFNI